MGSFFLSQWKNLKGSPWPIAGIMALIGILVTFLSYKYNWPSWIITVGTTILASALVGWVLYIIDVQNFFIKLMVNLSQEKNYLRMLKKEELDHLAQTAILTRYDLPDTVPDNNLYSFVREEVLGKYFGPRNIFFEDYDEDVEITPEGEEGVKILVKREITARTLTSELIEDVYTPKISVTKIPERTENHFFGNDDYIYVNGTNVIEQIRNDVKEEETLPGRQRIGLPIKFRASSQNQAKIRIRLTLFEKKNEQKYHLIFYKPTLGFKFKITIKGINKCNFEHHCFALENPDPRNVDIAETSLTVRYEKWMLPQNAFRVIWKTPAAD